MRCPQCGHENAAEMKFCGECGTRLAVQCRQCGARNLPAQKFCGECGARLDEPDAGSRQFPSPDAYTPNHLAEKILISKTALEGERKQVTVLFADLKGSMELLADRDPEDARKLLDAVVERMMKAVHHYEGTVNEVRGDGIMALFGAPLAHEDHAVRACFAALRMQEAVKRYADEMRRSEGLLVQIRVGLNSGEVVVRSIGSDLRMDYSAVGRTTHLAARMESFTLAKRIIPEVEVHLLIRGARTKRDRVLLEVLYAGGLRVSELAGLTWLDVLARDKGQVQLSVVGKGGVVRQVLLPEAVSRALLSLRGDAGANDPLFARRKTGARLTERAVLGIVKRAAVKAGIEAPVSPHWLRHAHASHAIDRGATLPEVQSTLGHGNIASTSGYLHARPESSSGL